MIHKTWSNSHRLYLDRARPSQGQSATSFKLPRRSILRSLISTVVLGFENFGKNTSGDGEKGRSGKLTWNGCGTERRGQKKWPPQRKAATSIERCVVAHIFIDEP